MDWVKDKDFAELTEHDHQSLLLQWAGIHPDPRLGLLFAIPNGGHRHLLVAMKLRAEGVKPGVPDLFLPVPRDPYHGLFIEMKAARGRVSALQKQWIDALQKQGYRVEVCRGWLEAQSVLIDYLDLGNVST